MSDFTDRMYKTFLPSAEAYIKSIQAQHRNPMKQIALINKEIATLTNPRNLKRASKSSGAVLTQYMGQLFKAQANAKKSAGKSSEQLQSNLDTYQEKYQELVASFESQESQDLLASAIRDLTQGTGPSLLEQNVAEIVNEKAEGKTQTRAQLFVLAAIDRELSKTEIDETTGKTIVQDYAPQQKMVQKLFLEKLLVPTINQGTISENWVKNRIKQLDLDEETQKPKPLNVDLVLNTVVPELSGSAEQYLMNPDLVPEGVRRQIFNKVRLSASDQDLALIRSEIKRTQQRMAGRDSVVSLPSPASSYQEKKAYVEQLVPKGLTLDEQTDRIIVDTTAPESQQKLALDFIGKNVGGSTKYSDFIKTEPVLQQASGITSGEAATKRMLDRAAELEEQKQGLIQLAALNRDITPAEQAVLRNPPFTRPSMRRTAPFRLMKRARGLDDRLAALNEELSQFDQPQEADALPVTRGESTGVPVIPATVKIFQDAVARYDVSGDIGNLRAARDAFMSMPDAVRDKFPEIFSVQLAQLDAEVFPVIKDGKVTGLVEKDGFNPQKRINELMASLDQTELTTETVSDFVALLAEDDSPDNVNRLKSMANFMGVYMTPDAPANALGKGADPTVDPMGSLGFAISSAETPEEIAAVKERAALFAQGGVRYDPNMYGTYAGIESVDPDEVAPDEPPVEQPVEQPEAPSSPPSRPSRMDRRIAKRAEQIEADRRKKELAAAERQQRELASRNFARQVEREDEEDALAEQEFIDEMVDIPTLKEGTLETDPDRFADQQKMVGDVDVKLKRFQKEQLNEANKKAVDQAAGDSALAAIEDPGTMDVGPVRSMFDQLRDENRRRRRSRQKTPSEPSPETPPETPPEPSKDPFDMGLPVPPPKPKEESEQDSVNDLLIASTRTSPPKRSKPTIGQGSDSGLLVGEMPKDPTDRITLKEFDLTGRTTAEDLDRQTDALFKQISLAVSDGGMSLSEANKTLTDYARQGPYDQQKIGTFLGQLNEQFGSKEDAFDELDTEAKRLESEGLVGETTTETRNPDGTVSGRVVKTPKQPVQAGP